MRIRLSSRVPVGPERAFSALIDPEILRRSIPGCEELRSENPANVPNDANPANPVTYIVKLKVGVAGLKGSYEGRVRIRDQRPSEALTLGFEGQGAPGFVRGEVVVTLLPQESGTEIGCDGDVQVGGLIAAVGSRLIEATAKKLADDFFRALSAELSRREPGSPGNG